jgi:hypothetical protein
MRVVNVTWSPESEFVGTADWLASPVYAPSLSALRRRIGIVRRHSRWGEFGFALDAAARARYRVMQEFQTSKHRAVPVSLAGNGGG